jgi:ABC-2 type transport system ATP-binding protein
VALIRAHTREMDMEPILIRGTVEAVVQFGSLSLAVGSYSMQVNLYHPQSGMMIESRRWDNAIMIVGGQKGVGGIIAAEASVFVKEVSSRNFL